MTVRQHVCRRGELATDPAPRMLIARRASPPPHGLLSGGYGEDERRAAGAFRVYGDAEELLESLDELRLAIDPV